MPDLLDHAPSQWILRAVPLGILLCLAEPPNVGAADAPPPEMTKVRALLVFDTLSDLGKSVAHDRWRILKLLRRHIPEDRLEIKVFEGHQVTADNILKHYKELKANKNETLLFYYAGHGATDPVKGHYLDPGNGKQPALVRATLRKAMEDNGSGLVVLLTDCCSDRHPLKGVRPREIVEERGGNSLHPAVRCLLFQARGTVDITAATNNGAYGDDEEGGVFTRSLSKVMTKDVKTLDTNRDQFVTWAEFFPKLQQETETEFHSWTKAVRGRVQNDAALEQTTQKPHAFALPRGIPVKPVSEDRVKTYLVVSFANLTDKPVPYEYRWSNETAWKKGMLEGKSKIHHFQHLSNPDDRAMRLEAKFEGISDPAHLEGLRWSGKGLPRYMDGWEYNLNAK